MDQPDITLHDVIAHITAMDQSLSAKIEAVEKTLGAKIENVENRLGSVERKVEDLTESLKTLQEDSDSFFGDIAEYVTTEKPHVRIRLDRLEQHANLPPVPTPAFIE